MSLTFRRRSSDGLYLPDDTEDQPMTSADTQQPPYHWTADGELHTDPKGFAPVPKHPARSPLVWLRRRSADVAQQLSLTRSARVIKGQRRLTEADELESIAADPRSIARANRVARRWSVWALLVSIAAGLLISASTAQVTITETLGWDSSSIGYWLAYAADPAIGVPLFAMLGVTALAVQREVTLPAATTGAFKRSELGLFLLVALLNGGPALASALRSIAVLGGASPETLRVMDTAGHGLMYTIVHLIGPVLVGIVIVALPHVTGALALISAQSRSTRSGVGRPAPSTGPVARPQSTLRSTPTASAESTPESTPTQGRPMQVNPAESTPTQAVESTPVEASGPTIPDPDWPSFEDAYAELVEAVEEGRVDPQTEKAINPRSAESIRRTLRVGITRARELRDAWKTGRV